MSMKRKSLMTYVVNILTMVISAITTILVARLLGPAGKGAYTMLGLLPYLAFLLGNLGIGQAATYYLCKTDKPAKIISSTLFLALILGFIVTLIFFICASLIQKNIFEEVPINLVFLSIAVIPFYFLFFYTANIFLALSIGRYNIINLLNVALPLFFLLLSFTFIKAQLDYAMFAWALGVIATVLTSLLMIKKMTVTGLSISLDYQLAQRLVRYGSKMYVYTLTQFLNFRLDYLFVSLFLPLAQVGYYSVSTAIAEVTARLPAAVATVIFPVTAAQDQASATALITKAVRETLALVVMGVLILFVVGKYIVVIFFGTNFIPSVIPLLILLPGMISISILRILTNGLAGRGQPEFGAIAGGSALITTIVLDIILIPRMGINGAALASSLAYSSGALVVLYLFVSSDPSVKISDILFIKKSDVIALKNYRLTRQQ